MDTNGKCESTYPRMMGVSPFLDIHCSAMYNGPMLTKELVPAFTEPRLCKEHHV